ncbi:transmembrane protein 258 isoform X1 [Bos taurus]|uniref:transmembrane protein 258 isoform X1 n=2 Tax=Bos taurus TaxID=9913 RepID=UPI000383DAC2|nr:transmembrane protein 258 isoform X1 [Bos taurus]
MELEAMSRYPRPVNPAIFPRMTVVLLAADMFFTSWFFVYKVTSTKYTWHIYKELLISLVASLFMGFGVLCLLLWTVNIFQEPQCLGEAIWQVLYCCSTREAPPQSCIPLLMNTLFLPNRHLL